MTIIDLLEKNSLEIGEKTALVEINPEVYDDRRLTWREYELVQPTERAHYRREITWSVFNEKANRFANALMGRGIGKGDKVAILLMNCLEWLPIYFGVLKTGAMAVPLIVMGDNRNNSLDSRSQYIGIVKEDEIIGRVLLRAFPFNKFGTVK